MKNPISLLLTAALVLGAPALGAQDALAQSATPSVPAPSPSMPGATPPFQSPVQSSPAPTPAGAVSAAPGSSLGTPQVSGTDNRLVPSSVSVEIGSYSGPLSSLLAAIARSAGYNVIFDTNVDALTPSQTAAGAAGATGTGAGAAASGKPVVYNFRNTPFNQVWPLLMDIYGLSYDLVQVGTTTVLRVGTNPIQRVIALKNANAVDAVNQIKLFFGTPTYSETPQRDAQGNVTSVTRTLTDVRLDSPTLRIVPDARTNSLIVRGTNREVNDVARLAAQLDAGGAGSLNGAAGSADSGSQTVQRVYSVKGQTADITTLLASQYPNLKVAAVGGTGQLVITGPQNQLDAALTLLGQVDLPPRTQAGTVQRVFTLVNASATNVKAVLDGTLARDLTTTAASNSLVTGGLPVVQSDGTTVVTPPTGGVGTTGATAATASTPTTAQTASNPQVATIIADARTNTLIVRGTQTQVNQIAEIIPTLDVKVPQINMQVRIQEVTDTASRSLGVDWNAGFGNFVTKIVSGTLTSIFDPTTALAGFNLGATLTALETQNLTKRVYDGSISMQSGQRSLGGDATTQNASNGSSAHIQSGGRLEINIPSSAANVAGISKQIDYGVTLDFYNPQVAPDGTITVQVRGVVNQPLTDLTSVSAANIPYLIRFSNSEAQTTITFKNGETVLLSGLLSTNDVSNKSGVPILSSLPIIGQAFSNTTTSKERTQLLVVITGNVLK